MSKKILFISHDASRTGAPKVLLELLKKLAEDTEYSFDVVFRKGGPLLEEFKQLSSCYVWEKKYIFRSVLKEIILHQNLTKFRSNKVRNKLLNAVRNKHYRLVYANSAMSADLLLEITNNVKIPIVQHIHELEYMLQTFCDPVAFNKTIDRTTTFIAVSEIVKNNLIQNHDIKEEQIALIHAFIPNKIRTNKSRQQIRNELKLKEDDFVIVGSGTLDLRKGTDLFIQVAKQSRERKDFKFIWIGGDLFSRDYFIFQQDIIKLGLENNIIITGSVDNSYDYYNAGDVFLMTSREDPFPLVCLEAAQLKKPVICFKNAVGSTEFINNKNGAVIPYLDLKTMASEVRKLSEDKVLLKKKGEEIFEASKKYNLPVAFDKISKLINNLMN